VDGKVVDEAPLDASPDTRWEIRLSTAVTNAALSDPVDTSRLPGYVDIDYVRHYRR